MEQISGDINDVTLAGGYYRALSFQNQTILSQKVDEYLRALRMIVPAIARGDARLILFICAHDMSNRIIAIHEESVAKGRIFGNDSVRCLWLVGSSLIWNKFLDGGERT